MVNFRVVHDGPFIAQSLAEVYLYLMITPCPDCSKGPLKGSDAKSVGQSSAPLNVELDAVCAACNRRRRLRFALPNGPCTGDGGIPEVNPTAEPSTLIDVAQYLTLFRVITAQAAKTKDRQEARRLGIEAALCLEEALKFYEPGNDLPPVTACFHDVSRRRLAEHPHEFSRQRLLDLRAKLPTMQHMRSRATQPPLPRRRRWWWPW